MSDLFQGEVFRLKRLTWAAPDYRGAVCSTPYFYTIFPLRGGRVSLKTKFDRWSFPSFDQAVDAANEDHRLNMLKSFLEPVEQGKISIMETLPTEPGLYWWRPEYEYASRWKPIVLIGNGMFRPCWRAPGLPEDIPSAMFEIALGCIGQWIRVDEPGDRR